MKYSAAYLDRYFDSIEEYGSKVELLTLANTGMKTAGEHGWISGLNELMSWQAMSERSGVWTYYEAVDPQDAEAASDWLREQADGEVFAVYSKGSGHCADEQLMNGIDEWIERNGESIDRLIERTLRAHKAWFYEKLDV
ncbi:hypothetical protein [Saccharibacillus alkalitolerans]|uniref:Uncharacterized protein n=1 Tax=Saccharibacillus alkalitolerans TaxID=2705290 RepID=A0ABX0FDB6_9BACL|nr:hypothetical protein [Saccharibacillus alkalitolerans]NGZ77688.1 hypothetical protein [Saccharibacillus alkalitolerans]